MLKRGILFSVIIFLFLLSACSQSKPSSVSSETWSESQNMLEVLDNCYQSTPNCNFEEVVDNMYYYTIKLDNDMTEEEYDIFSSVTDLYNQLESMIAGNGGSGTYKEDFAKVASQLNYK